ncbi:hypothetical protein TNCV_3290201, partial [Trichonephila clavipes]
FLKEKYPEHDNAGTSSVESQLFLHSAKPAKFARRSPTSPAPRGNKDPLPNSNLYYIQQKSFSTTCLPLEVGQTPPLKRHKKVETKTALGSLKGLTRLDLGPTLGRAQNQNCIMSFLIQQFNIHVNDQHQ